MGSGGIFTNASFEFNLKCILFAFMMILFYILCVPSPIKAEKWIWIPIIFVISYVGMAWYDYRYNCTDPLRTGKNGVIGIADSVFKPQRDIDDGLNAKGQAYLYKRNVWLFHILFIVPVLGWISYKGLRNQKITQTWSGILLTFTIGALLYHGFRFITRDTSSLF